MEEILMLKDVSEKFGGKAYGLNQLIKANIKIPNGFAITKSFIDKILQNDEKAIEKLQIFLSGLNHEKKLAIRSSANAEDGSSNSFAGMFETELNVENRIESVIKSIEKVNNSALSERVKAYSNNEEQKMNIVIQEMIEPKIAGVAFTKAIDVDGNNVVLIECVEGLAEKLVSGEATPSIVKVKLDGNDTLIKDNVEFSGKPMDIKGIERLIPEIQKIINYFQKPMDLEWCIDEYDLPYLVQARPITKIPFVSKKTEKQGILASPRNC